MLKNSKSEASYSSASRGVPVVEDSYLGPSAYEIGWPMPFHATVISPVLPQSTHSLLGGLTFSFDFKCLRRVTLQQSLICKGPSIYD